MLYSVSRGASNAAISLQEYANALELRFSKELATVTAHLLSSTLRTPQVFNVTRSLRRAYRISKLLFTCSEEPADHTVPKQGWIVYRKGCVARQVGLLCSLSTIVAVSFDQVLVETRRGLRPLRKRHGDFAE